MEGAIGACRAGGGGSQPPTPHLTSPLEGGRDEMGCRRMLGRVGSCLCRNDEKGRWSDGVARGNGESANRL